MLTVVGTNSQPQLDPSLEVWRKIISNQNHILSFEWMVTKMNISPTRIKWANLARGPPYDSGRISSSTNHIIAALQVTWQIAQMKSAESSRTRNHLRTWSPQAYVGFQPGRSHVDTAYDVLSKMSDFFASYHIIVSKISVGGLVILVEKKRETWMSQLQVAD